MSAAQGIGAGTQIVGGELQGWAALLDKWQMQDTFRQQMAANAAQRQLAQAALQQGMQSQGAQPFAQQMQQGAQQRMGVYGQMANTPLGLNTPIQQVSSPQRDAAAVNALAQNRAKLGSYQDASLAQSLGRQDTQRTLNQIADFARGQVQNVYPYKMYEAQHAWDDMAAIGAAISSIGGGAANIAQIYGQSPQQPGQAPKNTSFDPYKNQSVYDPYAQYGATFYQPY